MCGIFGTINSKTIETAPIKQAMFHRGPDAQNSYAFEHVFMYHFRLSIVDIEGGVQPMHHKQWVVIWNGEIYNHLALRQKYQLSCSSHSDTETLLHLYERLGPKMLEEMDGMFAMAILDKESGEVFLARDRAGKKPLFYYRKGKTWAFSSELNALKTAFTLSPNYDRIGDFLRLGYFYSSGTPYQDVAEMKAGTYILINKEGNKRIEKRWWSIENGYANQGSPLFSEALSQVDTMLMEGVKRRMLSSDLEVGCFLSGGIDSGLTTAMAASCVSNLKTFTISFDGVYNEAPLAKEVAQKYNTDHHEIAISFDQLEQDIDRILLQHGEPFMDASAIPSYYVGKAAKEHVTVVLNGDGADELFGGYRRYVPFAKYDFFKSAEWVRLSAQLAHFCMPTSHTKMNGYNYIYRLADLARKKGIDSYLSSTYDLYTGHEDQAFHKLPNLTEFSKYFNQLNAGKLSGLSKMMLLDFEGLLFGDLLVKMDIATMANSLEGRSPFLCKELLDYVPTLPDSFKIKGGTTKYLLRKLSEKYLPENIVHQPKRGFEIPLNDWVNGKLDTQIKDRLFSSNRLYKEWINPSFLEALYQRKTKLPEERRAKILYQLYCLETWWDAQ